MQPTDARRGFVVKNPESAVAAFPATLSTRDFLVSEGIEDLPLARKWMCTKLKTRGLSENIVSAFRIVPRHAFAPRSRWRVAYLDLDLWTGVTWMTSPATVARVVSSISFGKSAPHIYEVGTGTAYQTAIMIAMGATVITFDVNPECALKARLLFQTLGVSNVAARLGNGFFLPPQGEKFDAIIVNAVIPEFPTRLIGLLKKTGGVIIAPVLVADGSQRLIRYSFSEDGSYLAINLGMCRFAPAVLQR
jgi:protein-L-isoaspartate(D-aspartate) O-methyltransferase